MYELLFPCFFIFPLLNYLLNFKNIQFYRLSNKFIVSLVALFIPVLGILDIYPEKMMDILRYTQLSYYTIDLIAALVQKDVFQAIHHLIGYSLIYVSYIVLSQNIITANVIFLIFLIEQGFITLLSITLLLKSKYSSKELYSIIKLNYYINCILILFRIPQYLYIIIVYNPTIINTTVLFTQYLWSLKSFLHLRTAFYKIKL